MDIQDFRFNTTTESITGTLNVAHYAYQYDSSGHYNSIESSVAQAAIRLSPVTVNHKHAVWTAPHRTLAAQAVDSEKRRVTKRKARPKLQRKQFTEITEASGCG